MPVEVLVSNCWTISYKSQPWSLCCREARVEHNKIATRVLDRMPEKLSAATSEDEAMRQLDDWLLVLKHLDNLEAVHACSPLCAAYNSGLSRALLTAANAGKHNAIPLLAGVFRCSVPLVSLQVALDPTSHLHCSHDCVHHISRLLLDMLLSVHGNVHDTVA